MHAWQLHDAKARFSELVRAAKERGPQNVTVRGQSGVIVMSSSDYEQLTTPRQSFIDLLNASPLKGLDLAHYRDTSTSRDTEL